MGKGAPQQESDAHLADDVANVFADSHLPILLAKLEGHLDVRQTLLVRIRLRILGKALRDHELLQGDPNHVPFSLVPAYLR